jgi:hypothetical protein
LGLPESGMGLPFWGKGVTEEEAGMCHGAPANVI